MGERRHVFPASPWVSLSASLGVAVLSPPCLCNSAALGIVLGVQWVVIHAAGYGGQEECQNLGVLVAQFGDACLVSICHSFTLFSGANSLLGLERVPWEAGKPQDKKFVVPVKHKFLQDWSLSGATSIRDAGRPGLSCLG